jgi:hypothetical protein
MRGGCRAHQEEGCLRGARAASLRAPTSAATAGDRGRSGHRRRRQIRQPLLALQHPGMFGEPRIPRVRWTSRAARVATRAGGALLLQSVSELPRNDFVWRGQRPFSHSLAHGRHQNIMLLEPFKRPGPIELRLGNRHVNQNARIIAISPALKAAPRTSWSSQAPPM